MTLTKSPYSPSTPQSYNAHNTVINKTIDGINLHTHDPNQGGDTTSSGGPITQFGGADPRYTSIGPGSAAWSSLGSQTYKAAIPADPGETAIDPLTGTIMTGGTLSSYSAISYGHGQGIELARIRGQLAKITGQKWYSAVGAMVTFSAGGSGRDLTVGLLTGTKLALSPGNSSAPMTIAYTGSGAPPIVTNLNAQYVNGFTATTTPGTASTLIATNTQGLLPQTAISVDLSEFTPATFNSNLNASNTIIDGMGNLRYILKQWNAAVFGPAATWKTAASTPIPLVVGLNASGSVLSGTVQLNSGVGVTVFQDGPNSIRFESTGVAPYTDAPTLTYPDLFVDTPIYGSLSADPGHLLVTINGGLIGYLNGVRTQSGSPQYTYGPYAVQFGTTNYIWWNGGNQQSSYQVTTSGTSPGQGWLLVFTGTPSSGSNAGPNSNWTLATRFKQSIIGTRNATTVAALNTKTNNLITALANMGLVVDALT